MKAHLINMHLLVPRSRSSAKVKLKYKGNISQKMAVLGVFVFHKHILFKFVICKCLNPLPDDKNLDWSKLKAFADDKSNATKMIISVFDRVENIVGKGKIARYEQFLLFPQCFQKACFPGASKGVIVWGSVKFCCLFEELIKQSFHLS